MIIIILNLMKISNQIIIIHIKGKTIQNILKKKCYFITYLIINVLKLSN